MEQGLAALFFPMQGFQTDLDRRADFTVVFQPKVRDRVCDVLHKLL
jgi:hypothetical protein